MYTLQLRIRNHCELILLIDHSIAVANIFVNIHIASAPSLNFRGIFDAFLKQCSCRVLETKFWWPYSVGHFLVVMFWWSCSGGHAGGHALVVNGHALVAMSWRQ